MKTPWAVLVVPVVLCAVTSSPAWSQQKACMPDRSVVWSGCETGCCHYVLWEIAANCVEPRPSAAWQVPIGCEGQLPAPERLCPTIRLQAAASHVITFNDSKMNRCPGHLVHTLTIPREPVCGDDDPDRFTQAEDGFQTAWSVGERLIAEQDRIALVVNSAAQRSQNQLHIHTVRLRPGARQQLESLPVKPRHIDDLAQAWAALQSHAEESGFGGLYGAVVIRDTNAPGWLAAAVDGHSEPDPVTTEDRNAPEQKYSCWACDTCAD